MKLANIKEKIDRYFETVSVDEIVNRFKELGYEFEIVPDQYIVTANYIANNYVKYELTDFGLNFFNQSTNSFNSVTNIQEIVSENSVYSHKDLTNYKQAA